MFEVFKIISEGGKQQYGLGWGAFFLYIVSVILFFILGYSVKLFLDYKSSKHIINLTNQSQKDIEKFKNQLDAELENLSTANKNNLNRLQLKLDEQLEEYKSKLQLALDKSISEYNSNLDSVSELTLRDELVVKFVKTKTILKANEIKISLYQDLQKAYFEYRDHSDILKQGDLYDETYCQNFYSKLQNLKDKIFLNAMYFSKELIDLYLFVIIELQELVEHQSAIILPGDNGRNQNEIIHLHAQIDINLQYILNDIRNNQKPALSLGDIDLKSSEQKIINKVKEDVINSNNE